MQKGHWTTWGSQLQGTQTEAECVGEGGDRVADGEGHRAVVVGIIQKLGSQVKKEDVTL